MQQLSTPIYHPYAETEEQLNKFISDNDNVVREENIKSQEIYSMSEYANMFMATRTAHVDCKDISAEELSEEFLSTISLNKDLLNVINEQTKRQCKSQFWFEQRSGRLTESNFYRICHLRQNTDTLTLVKTLMNYCPSNESTMPEQLAWGLMKEEAAINIYAKKMQKKHKTFHIVKCELIVNKSLPYLRASPDGIRSCSCCKKVLAVKSKFTKRSLLPAVAAEEHLIKGSNGQITLKRETKWNYQIQGQMACTGIDICDLIIYTNKGILVVPVSFDRALWETMVIKLRAFYVSHMVPELLTKRIKQELS